MTRRVLWLSTAAAMFASVAFAETDGLPVADEVIAEQNAALLAAIEGKGFGPQSPRDID